MTLAPLITNTVDGNILNDETVDIKSVDVNILYINTLKRSAYHTITSLSTQGETISTSR